jgi:hypothetical protein
MNSARSRRDTRVEVKVEFTLDVERDDFSYLRSCILWTHPEERFKFS